MYIIFAVTSPKMNNYKTVLNIPVSKYQGDFDDMSRSRWLEQNSALMDTDFDRRRKEWDTQLQDMRAQFFSFSPFDDHHTHIGSANTIQPVSDLFLGLFTCIRFKNIFVTQRFFDIFSSFRPIFWTTSMTIFLSLSRVEHIV